MFWKEINNIGNSIILSPTVGSVLAFWYNVGAITLWQVKSLFKFPTIHQIASTEKWFCE